ncbi:MAG: hypothetical protein ACREJM_04360, partial [Candidatus Saccharimonadales bacterium]
EYGGADPGYQTVTIDVLAKLRQMTGDARLDEPLRRAVSFARLFLHADGSYGGEYGSRGTYHFYPHGFELLTGENREAAELADGFLQSIENGTLAAFDDDRMYAHRLGNLIEAYLDWSPTAPGENSRDPVAPALVAGTAPALVAGAAPALVAGASRGFCYLPHAGILVHRTGEFSTIISAARGGVFKHCRSGHSPETDTGLIIETTDGRQAVSQGHDLTRQIVWRCDESASGDAGDSAYAPNTLAETLTVSGHLRWNRHETATPLKQAVFHLGMISIGTWGRGLVRRALQRRLIVARKTCPIRLTRRFEFPSELADTSECRVIDQIELLDDRLQIRRLSFTSDLQSAYTAAG